MMVLYFDQTKVCIVCGKRREWCICGKRVKPCGCNPFYCTGGGRADCTECHGRGWLDVPAKLGE